MSDYTGFDFETIRQLRVDEYLVYLRDAFIFKMEQSESGQEYLKNAKRLETENTDYEGLLKAMSGGDDLGQ